MPRLLGILAIAPTFKGAAQVRPGLRRGLSANSNWGACATALHRRPVGEGAGLAGRPLSCVAVAALAAAAVPALNPAKMAGSDHGICMHDGLCFCLIPAPMLGVLVPG